MAYDVNEAVQLLNSCRRELKELAKMAEHVDAMRERCYGHTPAFDRDSGSRNGVSNAAEMRMLAYSDAKADFEKRKQHALAVRAVVNAALACMTDAAEVNLLTLRYLEYKNWDEMADELYYSTRWLYKLHLRALHSFQQALDTAKATPKAG